MKEKEAYHYGSGILIFLGILNYFLKEEGFILYFIGALILWIIAQLRKNHL